MPNPRQPQTSQPPATNGQELSLKPKFDDRLPAFRGLLMSQGVMAPLIATLPKHMTAERLVRVTLSAMTQNPSILDCTPESIILSLLRAASMGLEPDGGPLGQGYLVPFFNKKKGIKECQFIPGYRGLVKLARNSGEVADVWAEVVHLRDAFDYELGIDPILKHKRNDDVEDPGPLRFVYAVARFRDGEKKFVVMNSREIERIKKLSPSRDRNGNLVGPWIDHPEEMWKKTAVRRLSKLLPLSVEAKTYLDREDKLDLPANILEAARAIVPAKLEAQQTLEHDPPGPDLDPPTEDTGGGAAQGEIDVPEPREQAGDEPHDPSYELMEEFLRAFDTCGEQRSIDNTWRIVTDPQYSWTSEEMGRLAQAKLVAQQRVKAAQPAGAGS